MHTTPTGIGPSYNFFSLFQCELKLAFVQKKIAFVPRKINKNCCHQSCTFWLQYASNRLSAEASLQTPLGEITALPHSP